MKCRCGGENIEIQGVFATEPMQAWVICRGCGGRWSGIAHSIQEPVGRGPAKAIERAINQFINDGGKEDGREEQQGFA